LSFPSKVLVDEAGGRLFIADSGHHRIVVAALTDFEVLQVIGTGEAGLEDGDFSTAQFNTPQGMELVGDVLYVADTNNHAIRAVNLADETVTRIAGTGIRSNFLLQPGSALELDLRSPWDVTFHEGILYIAMAGTHQLWQMNLDEGTLAPFAGNGREDLIDGIRGEAELAQPSGVETDGEWVYFADSESSSIRRAEITDGGVVETLIGPVNERAGRLFEFGDIDGDIDTARLQHPLGVTLTDDGRVFFADTYNNKIKFIDPETGESTTFAGAVDGGYFDGTGEEALFDEPGGLDFGNGRLYVADTNNHTIRIINVEDASVASIFFPNVTALLPDAVAFSDEPLFSEAPEGGIDLNLDNVTTVENLFDGEAVVYDTQVVAPGEGTILVDAQMPIGYKLNALAPFTALWSSDEVVSLPEDAREYRVVTPELPIEFPVTLTEGETNLSVELTIYWCEAIRETLCFVERSHVILPIEVSADATTSEIALNYTLIPPEVPENTFDFSEDEDD
jgi:DNA-binding beta-propeller fold protein YncE